MRIGGLQKVSLIDYPGQISSVIFTQGCNLRCIYCHNPELVYPQFWGEPIEPSEILRFLDQRRGKIDAVVITGGEPLLHEDLGSFISSIKEREFLIKLDTNGTCPHHLSRILQAGLLDYVSIDVKAPWDSYQKVAGVEVDVEKVNESLEIILASGVEYECRVTVALPVVTEDDLISLGHGLKHKHVSRLVVQKFRPPSRGLQANPALQPPTDEMLERIKNTLAEIIPCVIVRK
ncbi:MAG: anaerobic ribonucleoside-triphosphate reductase activating protein [Syntrophales bacterium]|nr:anaerobic ribonucleoside-triphosphate reductase activating protein [Syntrophales bacterium]